ncbi:MAG: hypothetical protein U0W24_23975 [Bacteroidales bacterium]
MNKILLLILAIFTIGISVAANPAQIKSANTDSINFSINDSVPSILDLRSDYLVNSEVEHQKMLRNIFIAGFVLILGLLLFTIFFYGNKIKKVSEVILMQNDALNSVKDQLVKVIGVFNCIDIFVFITDSKGNIEWLNTYSSGYFTEDIEKSKINLITRFKPENQGVVFNGINIERIVEFNETVFGVQKTWKMVPLKNSKGEFSNMVFLTN